MDLNLHEFHYIRPLWWLALLPYITVLILLVRSKLSRDVWTSVCDPELLPYLLQNKAVAESRWPFWCGALAGFLVIIALTGPTWERLPTPVFRNDAALVIALDMSKTMDAEDIKPSRLTMARYKIADILKQRKDGQTALLVYADEAFTVTPLTNDTETIANQLTALTTDIIPADGNNINAALSKATDLLKQAGLRKGQILLVTDGGNLAEADVKELGDYQLLIVGVGTASGAPIALPSGGFMKNLQGDIIIDKVDIPGLEKLAAKGGGRYHSFTADDTDFKTLLATAATAKEQGADNKLLLEQWSDKGPWLLLVVLPLAALSFRKGLLMLVFCLLMPLPKNTYAEDVEWRDLWQTKDQQAQKAYNNGDYSTAAELFENPEWKATAQYKSGAYDKALENFRSNNNANSYYNQGNVLAQSGQLQEAIEAYNKALEINPDDEDAKYNKALVEKELEKQKQQEQQQNQQQNQNKKDEQNSENNKNQEQNKNGDKSDQSEQNPPQEKNDEQSQFEQKPQQKQEQSQKSTEQQPDKKESEGEQQKKSEPAQPEQVKQSPEEKKPEEQDAASQQAVEREMTNEEKQAINQWLKRIPDDPAGLLRRKFKYQYDQHNR
ncbi:MAG: VWA domain-containing protein [Gammaproteobacteria bacterium]|nr:VWA domain-containing protein [Gammaproteobacteria bacterium]